MKKFIKFVFTLIGIGTAIGGAFVYLKNKGYISVTTGTEDEDYDDFCEDYEEPERSYINVDTKAMKEKAKEMANELKEEIMDKAGVAYDEAKKLAKEASETVSHTLEKAEEKVEEFFNDED